MDETTKPKTDITDLARVETSARGLVLNNLEDMKTVAQIILQSKLAPDSFKTSEQIFVGLQAGAEIGLKPMQALNSIVVIKGKPTLWGDAALALVKRSGLSEYCKEYYELHGEKKPEKVIQYTDINLCPDDLVAICETKRKGEDEPVVRSFSVADAKLAHLWKKPGPWTTHPKRMLKYKARAFNLRDSYPDVLFGMHLTEEMYGEEPLPTPESDVLPRDERRGLAVPSSTLDTTRAPVPVTASSSLPQEMHDKIQAGTIKPEIEAEATPAEEEKPLCETCRDTGIAKEQHDGGTAELFCDCPIGKQKLEAFLKDNPDCRSREPEPESVVDEDKKTNDATAEPSIKEKGDVAALYIEVSDLYTAQNGTDFIEFAAYVLCLDESEVDAPSKFTEDQLKQIKAYIESNGVAIN